MSERKFEIVILGGGTAGWMAANLIAKRWATRARVKVIESSDIGTIGVGEGSTPQMSAFFRTLGISEAEWMPRCNATYKNGIRFDHWSARPGFETYFHPFKTDLDTFTMPAFYVNTIRRRRGLAVDAHPDRYSVQTYLATKRLAPRSAENFPLRLHYGYHFDSNLLGGFLREHAASLGVEHLDCKIVDVGVDETGKVTHLQNEEGAKISGDFFIDASGFRSVIVQEKLGTRFIPFDNNLFNDAAVVFPTDIDPDKIDAQTRATALKNGWAWKIPLRNRYGNGYVYSSRYCSAEEAEAELREHLGVGDDVESRHLKMKVGKTEAAWVGNCLAIGLAQSFVEPLEATALMVVQRTVERFIQAMEAGEFTPKERDRYNRGLSALCEGVREYIVGHYKVNGRRDTDYWRDNASNRNIPNGLASILAAWTAGQDIRPVVKSQMSGNTWGDLPWHSLLAGYGCFPAAAKLRPAPAAASQIAQIGEFVRRCSLNFEDHSKALEKLGKPTDVSREADMIAAE